MIEPREGRLAIPNSPTLTSESERKCAPVLQVVTMQVVGRKTNQYRLRWRIIVVHEKTDYTCQKTDNGQEGTYAPWAAVSHVRNDGHQKIIESATSGE